MPDGPGTIAELWRLYETKVLPRDAGPVQRQECRRAFYAGIRGWLDMLMAHMEEGDEATDADLQWMKDRDAELTEFGRVELLKMARPAGEG